LDISQEILSDIIVYMKYARYNDKKQRRETWEEVVRRNKRMHQKKFPELKEEIEEIYKLVLDKKVLPSMRSMQFAGKSIEISPNRIYNCAYLPIDSIDAFHEIMFLLLGGTGIGISVQKHHVEKLPNIIRPYTKRTKRFLIGDSIEGWAESIRVLIKSYFHGGSTIRFDFSDIRPKGARLITSGGKAPGPQPLKECLLKIRGLLDEKENGDKLQPIEVHDIICYIADTVLAGGIRRAALISLFSAKDMDMMNAKTEEWFTHYPHRGRANNSVVLVRHKIKKEYFDEIFERMKLSRSGEPGIFFTNDQDIGTNPCLTGDMLISTESGNISIKELVESEFDLPKVYTYNEASKQVELKKIKDKLLTKKNANIIKLELEDGSEIKLTPDHKVYTENRGWIEAAQLTNKDILFQID